LGPVRKHELALTMKRNCIGFSYTTVGVTVLVYVASKNEAQSAEAEAIWVVPRRVPVTARAQLSSSQAARRPKTVARAA